MNDITIQFQGFHPTEFTRAYLDSKIAQLQGQAPFGAQIQALFQRKNKTFTASVRIFSGAGRFFVSARGQHMREVSQRLERRLRKQLKRWKPAKSRALRNFKVGG